MIEIDIRGVDLRPMIFIFCKNNIFEKQLVLRLCDVLSLKEVYCRPMAIVDRGVPSDLGLTAIIQEATSFIYKYSYHINQSNGVIPCKSVVIFAQNIIYVKTVFRFRD